MVICEEVRGQVSLASQEGKRIRNKRIPCMMNNVKIICSVRGVRLECVSPGIWQTKDF